MTRDRWTMHAEVFEAFRAQREAVQRAGVLVWETLRNGKKVLACGNGGSAAQAEHFCAELVGRYRRTRQPLPAIALTAPSAQVTALANDFGWEEVFRWAVRALGEKGDLLVALTTSGRSANVISAVREARAKGLRVIALVGRFTELLAPWTDLLISVPSDETPIIQEMHLFVLHTMVEELEERWSGSP